MPVLIPSQTAGLTSSAVIEDGGALWVLGGHDKNGLPQSSTQIVRPGHPTVWGPNMTEETMMHCSATLANHTVMVTGGGRRSAHGGSARTEVYNFTTQQWERREDMNQRRLGHSCCTVWLDRSSDPKLGIISQRVDNSSVLSVVVAGGEPLDCLPRFTIFHAGTYRDGGGAMPPVHSAEVYIPWNNTWLDLPLLPDLGDGAGRMDDVRIMSLTPSGGGSSLNLIGGSSGDYNTGMAFISMKVWTLQWDVGSQTYSWNNRLNPELGR